MKNRVLLILLAMVLAISLAVVGCAAPPEPVIPPAPDKVVVGMSRSVTGIWALFEDVTTKAVLRQLVDKWNAEGGILLHKYGADYRVPIELLIVDDMSDPAKCAENTIYLIVDRKVDFLWGGTGTSMVFAQAPIANDHKMVLMTLEGGATKIKEEMIEGMPYLFVACSFSDWYQVPILADMLAAKGVKTAFIAYIDTEHGWEYRDVAEKEFARVGIGVVGTFPMAPDFLDFPAVISAAKASGADFFASFSSAPPQNFALVDAAIALDYNPDAFLIGPGGDWNLAMDTLGDVLDGVLVWTYGHVKLDVPGASMPMSEMFQMIEEVAGRPFVSPWLHPFLWAEIEMWKEAVETVGYVSQEELRAEFARRGPDDPFTTVLGPTWWTMFPPGGGLLAHEVAPGQVGQWQDGIVEIVGGNIPTADFIYPKPAWPK